MVIDLNFIAWTSVYCLNISVLEKQYTKANLDLSSSPKSPIIFQRCAKKINLSVVTKVDIILGWLKLNKLGTLFKSKSYFFLLPRKLSYNFVSLESYGCVSTM